MTGRSTTIISLAILSAAASSCASEDRTDTEFRSEVCFEDDHQRWIVCCETGSDYLEGTSAADNITGTSANECIAGLEANDTIDAAGGDDRVFAGPGNDTVTAGAGTDLVAGHSGDDLIDLGASASAATGICSAYGGLGEDTITGSAGVDHIFGDEDDDTAVAGAGDDEIDGGTGNDELDGEDGADLIRGRAGDDILDGGDGHDELRGNAGNDELRGGLNGDVLIPGPGTDLVYGEGGDDIIEIYDPCEIGSGSVVDGGTGDDTLYVPLPLTNSAMSGLSVTGVENVVVVEDRLWTTGAECVSTEPTSWAADPTTGVRWRWATAEERLKNSWLAGTRLVELLATDIAHGSTAVVIRSPAATGGLASTTLAFDQSFTGFNFHGLHYPTGTPTSYAPDIERYVAHAGSTSTTWGTAYLDDYGGLSGWVDNGTNQWTFAGSEGNAFIEHVELPSHAPSEILDYLILQPALYTAELDVTAPNLGDPYPGYLAGEGKWCTHNAENWMVKLFEQAQLINAVMRDPVGPDVLFDLQVAYCHFFHAVTISDPNLALGGKYFAATQVASWCDSTPEYKADFASWATPDDAPTKDDDYWGLHLMDCVDDDDHNYPFECGKLAFCYRDRAWTHAEHAQLHITVPNSKLAQVIHHGNMAGANGTAKKPWQTPGTPAVRGMATYPESSGNICTGLPAAGPDGCPDAGASVASTSNPPWHLTTAHEIAHNFGPTDTDWIYVNPPPASCAVQRTIMGTGPTQSEDCVALQFSPASMTKMLDCLPEADCPRSGYGP